MKRRHIFACAPLLLSSLACGGGGKVEGTIGGYAFDLSTFYAWIDATEPDDDEGSGKIIFKARPQAELRVVFAGASFDPTDDFRFLDAVALAEIARANQVNGSVSFRVTNIGVVQNGAILQEPDETMGDAPRLTETSHRFAAMQLEADAAYPPEAVKFGSRTKYKVTLESIGRNPGETVKGKLEISVERADNDPVGLVTGTITIEFEARLIHERIAECNAGGGQRSCELVL